VRTSVLFALSSTVVFAKPRQDRNRYCVLSADGTWALQGYPPLIDLHSKLIFEQVSYEGPTLELIRVRRFDPAYELVVEYKFNPEGQNVAMHGLLRRWSRWVAEADLYADGAGKVNRPDVKFYRAAGGNVMTEPEDGSQYLGLFASVPVYRTIEDIPCAGLLKEAEKKNATQE